MYCNNHMLCLGDCPKTFKSLNDIMISFGKSEHLASSVDQSFISLSAHRCMYNMTIWYK